jgi:hypothetical protein
MKRMTIRFPDVTHEQLCIKADIAGTSISQYITTILVRDCSENKIAVGVITSAASAATPQSYSDLSSRRSARLVNENNRLRDEISRLRGKIKKVKELVISR